MFIGLIILLVLMLLCAVVGGIYTYIYFTRQYHYALTIFFSRSAGPTNPLFCVDLLAI